MSFKKSILFYFRKAKCYMMSSSNMRFLSSPHVKLFTLLVLYCIAWRCKGEEDDSLLSCSTGRQHRFHLLGRLYQEAARSSDSPWQPLHWWASCAKDKDTHTKFSLPRRLKLTLSDNLPTRQDARCFPCSSSPFVRRNQVSVSTFSTAAPP